MVNKIIFGLILIFSAIASAAGSVGDNATVVHYQDKEAGTDEYHTRMIITSEYIRFDDGEGSTDFILFDRKKRIIYSTSSMDKHTLVIKWRKTSLKMPDSLKNRVEKLKDSVPPIGNKPVTHYRLYTNEKQCYDLFAAKGLLPGAVKAMVEFQETLAVEQADFNDYVPLQTASDCDRVNNIFDPARYLKFGFPVRANDYLGRSRQLVNYKSGEKVDKKLFVLPKGYKQYSTKDMRSR
ncbi:MAG: hypothetical protein ACC641_00580 [Acidiferrobacterales bacterium]